MKRARLRKSSLIIVAFIVSATILGTLFYQKYEKSRLPHPAPPPAQEAGPMFVTLFFADPSGQGLRRELREIDPCDNPSLCSEEILEELLNGPLGDLAPTLPGSFALRDLRVTADTAFIDLEDGSAEGLPEGSFAEIAAVYSIVDSLAVNIPQIKKVQFLMEGETMKSLKGHLDLREPLSPDYTKEFR